MISNREDMPTLKSALYDHDRAGVDILLAEPRRLLLALNLLIAGLIIVALAWSFFAKADVIVTASGTLQPDEDIRRVYPPVDGELQGLYVEVGSPVQAGDIVARINARGAVEAASKALDAKLKLEEARKEFALFPQKRELLQQKANALTAKLAYQREALERRQQEGMETVAAAQRARLSEARANLEQALRTESSAQLEAEKYERLAALPAGAGGVSKSQVRQKQDAYLDASVQRRTAEAKLAALEYEVNRAIAEADSEFAKLQQEVAELQVQQVQAQTEIEEETAKIAFKLRSAELTAQAAERLSFENFDEENYLKVFAPVSGVVTGIASSQLGHKLQASQPLVSIAPAAAERIVEVRIAEKDRGFLEPGQVVKLKFNAFPYRTYGSIDGQLETLSPTATQPEGNESPTYSGRISLARDTISTPQGEISLTYGMGAIAEIVVRERRFIDLALDPLRGLSR